MYHTFAALGHDVAAEMTLGYRHYAGVGVPPDCKESLFYYKRVADKGKAVTGYICHMDRLTFNDAADMIYLHLSLSWYLFQLSNTTNRALR